MADLLAKQDQKTITLARGQEIEGQIIALTNQEVILDLGTKAEGIIFKRDLPADKFISLKVGDKLTGFVTITENESGQAVLTPQKSTSKYPAQNAKWQKFQDAKEKGQTIIGQGIEVNKGGLIVEVQGIRGFLPSSQVILSQVANIDQLIGQDIELTVIEIDPGQNRLIFTQKVKVSQDTKETISKLKVGDVVKGTVAAVLQFGIFVTLENGVEGLVHTSEISWEKTENPTQNYKVSDPVEAKVISLDPDTGRVNLSIKQLAEDPFAKLTADFQPDDVVKGIVAKVTIQGANVTLADGIEGFVPAAKMDPSITYEVGDSTNFLVDTVDSNKRRINLAPFLTSTEGLIYK